MKGSEAYSILGFRVPTTSVCKQGVRYQRGVKGTEGERRGKREQRERRGAKRILY